MATMMLFEDDGSQTITVLRKGVRDWAGDPVGPNEFADSHTISDVLVDEEQTSGQKFRRDEYEFKGTLLMPIGSDILPTDQVELEDGERVVIYGKPRVVAMGLVRGMAVKFRSNTGRE